MDVKEAARTARAHIADLFADENVQHVGLEEVEFDDVADVWNITIGFSRPWELSKDPPKDSAPSIPILFPELNHLNPPPPPPPQRSYKIVRVRDSDGHVISVTHRALAEHN